MQWVLNHVNVYVCSGQNDFIDNRDLEFCKCGEDLNRKIYN